MHVQAQRSDSYYLSDITCKAQYIYVGAYKYGRYPAVSFSCFLRLLRRVVADKTKETATRETNKLVHQALVPPFPYVPVTLSVRRARISKAAVSHIPVSICNIFHSHTAYY